MENVNHIHLYKEAYNGGNGEIVEKKSRFIATTKPVKTEEEAVAFIAEIKKIYWDARHNCHAFVIGDKHQISRCSDDGEPAGTAGKPMLDVLLGEDVHNICVVVTRYFGGTLLGTGGLVRAYQRSVKEGLEHSQIIEKQLTKKVELRTDYNGIGKIQYILGQEGIHTLDSEYTDQVRITVIIPIDEVDVMIKKITEATSGKTQITLLEVCYSAVLDGEVLIFE